MKTFRRKKIGPSSWLKDSRGLKLSDRMPENWRLPRLIEWGKCLSNVLRHLSRINHPMSTAIRWAISILSEICVCINFSDSDVFHLFFIRFFFFFFFLYELNYYPSHEKFSFQITRDDRSRDRSNLNNLSFNREERWFFVAVISFSSAPPLEIGINIENVFVSSESN